MGRFNRVQAINSLKLTPKQKAMLQIYSDKSSVNYLNARASAIEAGYVPTSAGASGAQVIRKSRVKAVLDKIAEHKTVGNEITKSYIQDELIDVIGVCKLDNRHNDRISALNSLAKTIGAFVDVQASVDLDLSQALSEQECTDLDKLAAEYKANLAKASEAKDLTLKTG